MSEIDQQNFATKPRNRRAVVKGAAWSVPVIAAAIAAPAASASATNAGVAWSSTSTGLLWLGLLGNPTASATLLGNGPTAFTVTNGAGPIAGPLTVTITIAPTTSYLLNLGGIPKGIAVRTVDGSPAPAPTVTGGRSTLVLAQSYTTSTTFSIPGPVAGSTNLPVAVEFGYTTQGTSVSVGILQKFDATLTVVDSATGTTIGTAQISELSSLLNVNAL